MVGKKVVDLGSYWWVGDGTNINVVSDPWLPTLQGFTLPWSIDSRLYGLKVGNLIDRATKAWDCDRLNNLFEKNLLDKMLQIPINKFGSCDKLIWSGSNDGILSLKSAYFHARVLIGKECHLQSQPSHLWGDIWSSMLSPYIKVFIWKRLHNILPCSVDLQWCGMNADTACWVCGSFQETGYHILLQCKVAMDVWSRYMAWFFEVYSRSYWW